MSAPHSFVLLIVLSLCTFFPLAFANQRVLVYTAVNQTDGYYHDSIPDAVQAFKDIGQAQSIDMIHCDDSDIFASLDLTQFDALAFVSAAGSVLNPTGAANFEDYIARGGGYIGVHEASCAATNNDQYLRVVGACFQWHPQLQEATLDVDDHSHPSTDFLNTTWDVYDEVYTYANDPRDLGAHILLSVQKDSAVDKMLSSQSEVMKFAGGLHPIAWYREGHLLSGKSKRSLGQEHSLQHRQHRLGLRAEEASSIAKGTGSGRSWFSGLGHTKACWSKPDFLRHMLGGVLWVLASEHIQSNQVAFSYGLVGQINNGSATPAFLWVGREETTITGDSIETAAAATTTAAANVSMPSEPASSSNDTDTSNSGVLAQLTSDGTSSAGEERLSWAAMVSMAATLLATGLNLVP